MILSKKQQNAFDAIQKFVDKNKYPPSVRDVMKLMGLKSASTAYGHLCRLKKKGLVDWETEKIRTLKITKRSQEK